MGALTSRQHAGVEELDIQANAVYRYPPKTGNYFASHFIMGGEKFETSTPEGYLFGENTDLNFLGNRPVPFPYPAPPPHEPVKTIRSLVNIRKDSLRLVRITDEAETPDADSLKSKFSYNVEFVFDSDVQVAITIYYQATEEFHNGIIMYTAKHHLRQSETVLCKGGVSQLFSQTSHVIDPSEWNPEELTFDLERDVYPMVIHAVVTEGEEYIGHSHVLLATFDKHTDGSFFVKPLKQKQVVDGVSYLLQEIYGIENKGSVQELKTCEDDISDNSTECVVCLSDIRDTLILPCRHLCLCSACADTLRYQANNCPICRLPFRALLQIRAMRRKSCSVAAVSYSPVLASQSSDNDERTSCEQVHMGYEVMSLLEALNGPLSQSMPAGPPPVAHEGNFPSLPSSSSLPSSLPVSPAGSLSRSGSRDSTRKKLTPKTLSRDSSVIRDDDEKDEEMDLRASCHRSVMCSLRNITLLQDCGVTPEHENLTVSSGPMDPSSCTITPSSSLLTSPEDQFSSSLPHSAMSLASSLSQRSRLTADTLSTLSASYPVVTDDEGEGPPTPPGEPQENVFLEEGDSAAEGEGWHGRTVRGLFLPANNNNTTVVEVESGHSVWDALPGTPASCGSTESRGSCSSSKQLLPLLPDEIPADSAAARASPRAFM
ncbi:E3 ubiquitin-protein ligase MGRN1 isoform X1 [Lethenteron reissneri]|uniref:E3 ubiquitin-protein ligase MGRN1 isoform X1 n=1 Tax=Lethenteron reissneri TaxID=7753 RepID=UPI002AB645DF|nr:E3 ubiquitin-protein ligase MGRN1 isoform X1 [Lethenteron reissneri]XP_061426056.1 E3 ubiquitin-protein ligase MGRN1 isoform X1 [Lethenteron reissneri]XP_061426057.1 E3 ubiquitin-protein ligase MGRN1 isoform X1 [Lethenteron reissneri]XP_061426058.1 E3 ubiquitin-protein ligase MGRN1 isoform X1 [Lethenteron reissneri]XP_061426059.1 E3 ubiquitin-protein ligase MGRN1 isoform X1 [Lethenteron reissneri]XP_061426061.1 E3 ubiquitin-protein ligase MGRN1 isoform X1 [Lethenteron reissneri]